MKEVEVEIISREDIKPSSATPSHLGIFKLCLLDHLIPAPYAPIIFFYPSHTLSAENPKNNILHLLKQSLSETLTLFYPLAGKIKDDFSIHCNDEGANFIEAKVNCSLSEFLTHPDLVSLHKLLPCDLKIPMESYVGSYISNIQVNVFDCGGISIGLCISHRILDGASLSRFLKVWTSMATEENHKELVVKPELLMASSLFPMNSDDSLWFRESSMAMWGSMFKKGKFVTRRFWFSNSAIAELKVQIMVDSSVCGDDDDMVKNPTRLEIVSAILWKSFMDASNAQSDCCNKSTQLKRASLVSQLVNLRKRIKDDEANLGCPAENAIGNLLWLAFAKSNMADNKNNNNETRLDGLVKKLRKALSTIDDKFIENMRSNFTRKSTVVQSLNIKSIMIGDQENEEEEEVDCLGFSSWSNFGFYEVDFGWGKPLWVSSIGSYGSLFMNLVILVDSWFGDGIEAWVTLDEPFMAHLETNPELLGYAILDPSPLATGKQLDSGPWALYKI
ncbi:BAHD acyltransferase At5g47980-like [Neltuma alba]|uniref:BAHD acyltransferase At5g47980-like n=1 Tax=Neltuma alba TaxID=207710 RepID=UPI0010A4F7DB|nr:BAHD acyltransferase At5g47980-like [Prosopis alba]